MDVREKSLDDGLLSAVRFVHLAKNAFSGKIRFSKSNKFNALMRKYTVPQSHYASMAKIKEIIYLIHKIIDHDLCDTYQKIRGLCIVHTD